MSLLAQEYVQHGWLIVPFPRGVKSPVRKGWNDRKNCVTDPEIAEFLDENIGIAHAYSGTCCLDIDDLEQTRKYFAKRGLNLDLLLNAEDAVFISSGRENRAKLLYKLDTPWQSFRLGLDPKKSCFELRCATSTGKTVQDVLPPSIHPDTGKSYEWKYNREGSHWSKLPPLPIELRKLWESLFAKPTTDVQPAPEPSGSIGLARELLYRHSPDCGYDQWLQAGMALHHETAGNLAGLNLWDEWSKRSSKYAGRSDLESHWRSFGNSVRPVTLASLRIDECALPDEFDIVKEEDLPVAQQSSFVMTNDERRAIAKLGRNDNGRVLAALPNLQVALSVSAFTRIQLAYDEFKDALMFAPIGTEEWRPFKDTDYTALRIWLETTGQFNPVSREMIRDAVHFAAEGNKMDTAQLWLNSLTWDGVPRIENFFHKYMGAEDTAYTKSVGLYWWTGLAGRIMQPGCQADMIPILVGKQGVGKSTGIAAMVPNPEFFTEIHLEEPDEVIARKMRGLLIGELAEMRGLRTAAVERILAFVTRKYEKWVPKYQEFATTFARRCMLMGTSNDDELLYQEENRRWLPMYVEKVDRDAIIRDRNQLWAEGKVRWQQCGIHYELAERLGKEEHRRFKSHDSWTSLIEPWLDQQTGKVRMHQVLVDAVGLDPRNIKRTDEMRAGTVMHSLGWDKKSFREGDTVLRYWYNRKAERLEERKKAKHS